MDDDRKADRMIMRHLHGIATCIDMNIRINIRISISTIYPAPTTFSSTARYYVFHLGMFSTLVQPDLFEL